MDVIWCDYIWPNDLERLMSRLIRFWRPIIGQSRKGAELGHMLLLNTNRKPYMGSQNACTPYIQPWPWHILEKWRSWNDLKSGTYWANVGEWELISTMGRSVCNNHVRLQNIVIHNTNSCCQADRQGPWISCFFLLLLVLLIPVHAHTKYMYIVHCE